jgi:hypothetical protein
MHEDISDYYVGKEEIDLLWHIIEDLSVHDAVALVAGYNPTVVKRCESDTYFDREFSKYPIVLKALTNAITNGKLKAALRYSAREYGYADAMADFEYRDAYHYEGITPEKEWGFTAEEGEIVEHDCFYKPFPDWSLSTVARDDLVAWLSSRGIRDGFFFSNASNEPEYLNPNCPRYAPKLAAAVSAWQAVNVTSGKSPKQALEKWLRENAAKFGLTDENGNPVNQAIEDSSKVANWQLGGGAPKTPS